MYSLCLPAPKASVHIQKRAQELLNITLLEALDCLRMSNKQ